MSDLYEAILRARGEQIVGRIDPRRDALDDPGPIGTELAISGGWPLPRRNPRRDALAHSLVREVAPRYEPQPPLRYSLTWQVVRDVLLASVAFAFLAVALVFWLAGAR